MTKTRSSRWSTSPVLDRAGKPKVAQITAYDIDAIFAFLSRYRYLPIDYLHALGGGSLDYLVRRLNLLSREPNRYVSRPAQQRANASANYRRLIYELADKGEHLMQERGFACRRTRGAANFAHELMVCQVMASFELGTRVTDARLITWEEILRSESLPETTRRSDKPYHIPVTLTVDSQRVDTHIAADGHPFGISRPIGGRSYYWFCPGIEADCGTEPVDTSDFVRASIYKKFTQYLAIEAQGIHQSHFGFPNFYVPLITTTTVRLASMMRLLERITGGAGSKIFLFKVFPALTSFDAPRPPSGHMLTEDWQRVGHPPFNFVSS